jgi:hypothetical protein
MCVNEARMIAQDKGNPRHLLAAHSSSLCQKSTSQHAKPLVKRLEVARAKGKRIGRPPRTLLSEETRIAMANLGHRLSDQTVGNIGRRHDIPPAPKRKQTTSWKEFIRAHMAVLVATDFFTVEVLTLKGLITYYVLFFIHLESRRICLAGVTRHPDQEWMEQMARNVTMEDSGFLIHRRYLLHVMTANTAHRFVR